MGSLDLPIELGGARLDVDMSDSFVLNVPMEQSLKPVNPVGAQRVDTKWESLDHVVHEIDGVLLRVPSIDPQRPDPRSIVDGRVLEPTHPVAISRLGSVNLSV